MSDNDPITYNRQILRERLAHYYEKVEECRLIASDIGLDTTRIAWTTQTKTIWEAILRETEKQGKLPDLIQRVQHDYAKDPLLLSYFTPPPLNRKLLDSLFPDTRQRANNLHQAALFDGSISAF